MIELLAPAGDFEKMRFAFLYGADAVYFGGKNFSLRANAKNLSLEEIKKAGELAHSLGKKIYVAVNIVLHNEDLEGLEEYLKYLDSIDVDGIIASDIYVIEKIRDLKLRPKVIMSTQGSVLNHHAAEFYKNLGVKQIVLAREAMKEDIIKIKKETGIEVECFIHGAMCTSISGKCILSNYMTGRDSNRGGCAQICRWVFNETDEHPYTMTPKDLNFIDYVGEMIDAGISTFKIEGRMRSIYYIATVTLCYRRVIDKILKGTLTEDDRNYYLKILNRCANRDSAPQFFKVFPTEKEQYFITQREESNQDFLGVVLDFDKENMMVTIEERNLFKVGDEVEFFGPNMETFSYKVHKIYDEHNNSIQEANKPKMVVKMPIDHILNKDDLMRVKIN